jgi:hypothetical protein
MRWPFTSRTWPGSNGSIIPCAAMRRIHLSFLMLIVKAFLRLGSNKHVILRLEAA